MSDSSSEEEVVAPKAKAKPVVQDSSSDEETAKAPAPKAKAAAKAAVDSDSDDSEDGEARRSKTAVQPTGSKSGKSGGLAKPAVQNTSDSDADVPATPARKVQAVVEESDSDDEDAAPVKVEEKVASLLAAAGSDDSDDSDDGEAAGKGSMGEVASKAKLNAATEEPPSKSSKPKADDNTDELRVFVTGIPWKVGEDQIRKDFASCGTIKKVKVLIDKETEKPKGAAFVTFKTPEGVKAILQMNGDKKKFPGRTLKVERALKPGTSPAKVTKTKSWQDMSKEDKKKAKEEQKRQRKLGMVTQGESIQGSRPLSGKMLTKMLNCQKVEDWRAFKGLAQKLVERAAKLEEDKQQAKDKSKSPKEDMPAKEDTSRKDSTRFSVYVSGLPGSGFDEDAFRRRFQDCGIIKYLWLPTRTTGERKGDNKGFGLISFNSEESVAKALSYDGTKIKSHEGCVMNVTKALPKKKDKEASAAPSAKVEKKAETQKESSKRKAEKDEGAELTEAPAKKKNKAANGEAPEVSETSVKKKKNKNASEELPAESAWKKAKATEEKATEEELKARKKDKKAKKSAE